MIQMKRNMDEKLQIVIHASFYTPNHVSYIYIHAHSYHLTLCVMIQKIYYSLQQQKVKSVALLYQN